MLQFVCHVPSTELTSLPFQEGSGRRETRQMASRGADPNIGVTFVDPHARADAPPPSNSGAALNAAASNGTIAVIDLLIERGAKLENSAAQARL
jgi:ankyrin repeat protein